jgi:hypothetical protein
MSSTAGGLEDNIKWERYWSDIFIFYLHVPIKMGCASTYCTLRDYYKFNSLVVFNPMCSPSASSYFAKVKNNMAAAITVHCATQPGEKTK